MTTTGKHIRFTWLKVQYLPDFDIAFALQVNDDLSHDNFSLKKYFNTIRKVVLNHSYPTFGKSE
jgi:hypothetical protein